MSPEDANKLAEKIKGLFPKMTDQQVIEVAERLDDFDAITAESAVDRYAETNDEFTLSRVLTFIKAERDPFSMPNSYENRTAERTAQNETWKQNSVSAPHLKQWWEGIDASNRADMIELFKVSESYVSARWFYDTQFAKGRFPVPFLLFAHDQASRAGAA